MTVATKNLLIGTIAAAWFLLVNVVFFWQRIGHSSLVKHLLERLGM